MLRITTLLLLTIVGCTGCDGSGPELRGRSCLERPVVNLPASLRQQNWVAITADGQELGSCAHAELVSLLVWENRPETALRWRRTHGGGVTTADMHAKLDAAGIRYAATHGRCDVSFLEWSLATRRGCAVCVPGWVPTWSPGCEKWTHMLLLADSTPTHYGLIDCNDTSHLYWINRGYFLREWKSAGSWALSPLYSPLPPLPEG